MAFSCTGSSLQRGLSLAAGTGFSWCGTGAAFYCVAWASLAVKHGPWKGMGSGSWAHGSL